MIKWIRNNYKHENQNLINIENIFYLLSSAESLGPQTVQLFYFTNLGVIENLHIENHLWPSSSKVFILNQGAGTCINPSLGTGEHELI